MTYEQLKNLNSKEFKRLCGVHFETFNRMVEVLQPDLQRTGKRGGQPKLSVEDQLLMTLEYWREYRNTVRLSCIIENNLNNVTEE